MTSYIIIPIMIFHLISAEVSPIYLNPAAEKEKFSVVGGVLKGNVSASKELPAEFYGTWSVKAKIIRATNTNGFRIKGSDIWVFEKNKDIITLTNPANGASASITVDEVKGKTATFTRKSENKREQETETATITVDGDSFYGVDKINTEYYRKGELVKTSVVEYEVKGTKIAGPRLEEIFSQE